MSWRFGLSVEGIFAADCLPVTLIEDDIARRGTRDCRHCQAARVLPESEASAGRHKARVFASALNLHQSDAEFLRTQLLDATRASEVLSGEVDEYGQRYILDFECVKGLRLAAVRNAWIVLKSEDYPRLTTCYVLSD